jgi:HlyD family secretion protein
MTANITINVRSVDSALIVPTSALRFTPPAPAGGRKDNHGRSIGAASGKAGGPSDRAGVRTAAGEKKRQERVFVLADNKLKRVPVTSVLSNGENTAVTGDLSPGQLLVVGAPGAAKSRPTQQAQPFGMPRRF